MWKTITQPEKIKDYPVGTRVRVDGKEDIIIAHYGEGDPGFDTARPILPEDDDYPDKPGLFASCDWDEGYTVDVWDGPSLQDELTAALKSVIDLVDRDVIRIRASERDQFLEALEQWNAVLAKVEESK